MIAELSASIRNLVRQIMFEEFFGESPFVEATWVAAESWDANLSHITILGEAVRSVPKSTADTFVAGDGLLCVRGKNTPLTIIGKRRGDITQTS